MAESQTSGGVRRKLDTRAIALYLIGQLGERATSYALHRALAARQRGDLHAMERWRWIAGATREILRVEPEVEAVRRDDQPS